MLDVHPPHAPTHTWKDFFIHIATIVIGLLIAVGLEQTVEFFHHREQRHRLQEDLHAETLRNLHIALDNFDVAAIRHTLGLALYQEVVTANHEHRLPVLHGNLAGVTYGGADAVWTTAQQSGTLGLLPHEEAQRYARVYKVVDQIFANNMLKAAAQARLHNALLAGTASLSAQQQTLAQPAQDSAAWAALQGDDFREARNALADNIGVDQRAGSRYTLLYVTEWEVLHGSQSDEEMTSAIREALAIYEKGGKAALLAKYPLPADVEASPSAKNP